MELSISVLFDASIKVAQCLQTSYVRLYLCINNYNKMSTLRNLLSYLTIQLSLKFT